MNANNNENMEVVNEEVEVNKDTEQVETEATENVEVTEAVAKNEQHKKSKKQPKPVRFDKETGYIMLRVSNNTQPKKLGGAIFKNFKDGCKALVVSFIGKDATVQALKGISVANVYLQNSTDEEKGALVGKTFSIVPNFHTFDTEIGEATTTKITVYAVDVDCLPN